jgi:2-oxo-4-hydroxy-4-carboxy-5-ureidoimidazoline decarboxylase
MRKSVMELSEFNAMSHEAVTGALTACCDVPSWVAAVREGRPYADVDDLVAVADKAAREFSPTDVDRALAAHARIGERAASDDQAGRDAREAAWSRQEQAGVDRDPDTAAALQAGNRAYEERFGRVFLICATGLSADEILSELHWRLANDEASEAAVVAEELRKIALVRLCKVLES